MISILGFIFRALNLYRKIKNYILTYQGNKKYLIKRDCTRSLQIFVPELLKGDH